MSRQFAMISTLLTVALLLSACANFSLLQGSGKIVRESRAVSDFTAVEICCGMQLTLTQGEPTSVEIEGDDNILPEIETLVAGDRLTVQFRQRIGLWTNTRTPIQVYVTMPTISGVEVSGGGALTASTIQSDAFQLTLSGGSHADIDELQVTELRADLSGGAHATIMAGTVPTQLIDASGGSHYLAEELQSAQANLDISGGSEARIWASDSLVVDASGGSEVAYYGRPNVEQDVSGGSDLNALGER
jgi:Putative auto-transporter adhesin, head GIN domain